MMVSSTLDLLKHVYLSVTMLTFNAGFFFSNAGQHQRIKEAGVIQIKILKLLTN